MGEPRQALEYHQQSADIRRALGDRSGEASSLNQAGVAWHKLGDIEKAAASLRESLAIRRLLHEPSAEADTLVNIAAVERDRGDLATAQTTLEMALSITESLRARISDADLRASYIARVQETYASYVDVLMGLHGRSPSAGHDRAALQTAERSRARVLLESLVAARVDVREGVDPALLERERSLQRKLDAAAARLSRGLSSRATDAGLTTGRRELESLTADYQQVQVQIRAASPRYAALTQPEPLTAGQIQLDVLDADTVLLEFALGERQSWLWAVTPGSITSVPLPARRDLEAAARAFYEEATARQPRAGEAAATYASRVAASDSRMRNRAAAVSRLLFGGIAKQLNGPWRGKRLAIVATGALEYLPFAALHVPDQAPAIPLIARHEIVTIPSMSVLATLRRESAGRAPAARMMAIVADPVFDRSDPRVINRDGLGRSPGAARGVDLGELATAREGFARLPFSREEATAIASLAGPRHAFTALDFGASRATVLGGGLRGYRFVHFATHGIVDSRRPALSGLILSLFDERGAPQNGYLRLHDIYNIRLDADLVVLSACQTALGKEITGEGLVSLTRAFMYAGAPRVVATLWQVSDHATAELMRHFYRGILRQKLQPATALRSAQRQLARDPRWASPYYWAGFVMQGDWR